MFGTLKRWLRLLWAEKAQPEGSIHDIDWRSEVRLLRLELGRQPLAVDDPGRAAFARLDALGARLDAVEKIQDTEARSVADNDGRLADHDNALKSVLSRLDALERAAEAASYRLGGLEAWHGGGKCQPYKTPDAAPPRTLPVPGGREADGYDASPCPFCRGRKVVSSGGHWTCDACRSCGVRDDRGYTVVAAPAPTPPLPSPEDEARHILRWLRSAWHLAHNEDDVQALATELLRWREAQGKAGAR